MFNLALVVEDNVSLLQEVLVLLLGLLEHCHRLLVDVLAQSLLLASEIVEPRLVVLVAVCLKVEVRAGLAKESLLLLDPRVLLLHPGHHDVRLLVVLLQLLDLVAEALLLQLLLLPLLPVCSQLRGQAAEELVQALELAPQALQPGAELLMRGALRLQRGPELLNLGLQALVALARGLLVALLREHLVAHDLELDVGLLRLLALLLDLVHLLLGGDLELLHLLLEVLDALLAARVKALDLLLELLCGLLELLFLVRQRLQVRLELLQLRPGPLQGLLGGVVLAPVDAVLDECELVLLALQVTVHGVVLRGRGLHARQLRPHLVELPPLLLHLLLQLRQLLQPHEDVAALGGRPARDRAGGVVQVAVLGHRAHADVGVEANLLGRLRRVTHEETTEHVPHGTLNLPLEADDL
mmetsp:Transcript_101345/g.282071  ORF Transcript_101345/g.282071 Transcript_101345/m.282071 type:complete len:411 (-) Transcript_101345:1879-3111(-)